MTTLSLFKTRLRKAVRTRDEAAVLNAVAELAKDPDLMGEVLAGDDMPSMGGGSPDGHHVTINVHGGSGERKTDDDESTPTTPEGTPGGGGDRLAAIESRLDNIEEVLSMLAQGEGGDQPEPASEPAPEEKTGDKRAKKTKDADKDDDDDKDEDDKDKKPPFVGDSSSMNHGFLSMLSQAEILKPGIALPTFDSALPARTTFDAMCSFRRKTLDASYETEKGKSAIDAVLGGMKKPNSFHDTSITCDSVAMVFNGAASLIASQNTGRATQPHLGANGGRNGFSAMKQTPADLNKQNKEFYAR